jgi:hypothetical protein
MPGCSMYRSLFGDFDFMEMFLGWDYHACKRRCRLTLGCSNRIIGPAFFIIWTLIGLVVLFNMYVATLSRVSYFVWLTNRFRTCLLPSSWKAMKLRRSLEVNFSLARLEDGASRCPCPGCRSSPSSCMFCVLWFNSFFLSRAGGPNLVSMLEESFMKPMQENFQAMMRKLR